MSVRSKLLSGHWTAGGTHKLDSSPMRKFAVLGCANTSEPEKPSPNSRPIVMKCRCYQQTEHPVNSAQCWQNVKRHPNTQSISARAEISVLNSHLVVGHDGSVAEEVRDVIHGHLFEEPRRLCCEVELDDVVQEAEHLVCVCARSEAGECQ